MGKDSTREAEEELSARRSSTSVVSRQHEPDDSSHARRLTRAELAAELIHLKVDVARRIDALLTRLATPVTGPGDRKDSP